MCVEGHALHFGKRLLIAFVCELGERLRLCRYEALIRSARELILRLLFRRLSWPAAGIRHEFARPIVNRDGDATCKDAFRAVAESKEFDAFRSQSALGEIRVLRIEVEHSDPKHRGGGEQPSGDHEIRVRWFRFADWVIVHEHGRIAGTDDTCSDDIQSGGC